MRSPSTAATSRGLPTAHPADALGAPARSSPEPASWRDRLGAFWAMALIALALVGCATQAKQVLGSENEYVFYSARYAEVCVDPATTTECSEKARLLKTWHGAVQEAADALKRGGPCPLQIERLKKIARRYPK